MRPLFKTVTDLSAGAEPLRRRSYGVIEAVDGRFRRVVLRPFPKLVSIPEILLLGRWVHARRPADRCRLYYNRPRRFPNFLAVKYVVSGKGTSYLTCRRVSESLDEIARIQRTDAMVCELTNHRITDRMMARWGWEPHRPSSRRRHFIRRFWGTYPPRPDWLAAE